MSAAYTIGSLADRWGVAPVTIRRLIQRGELRGFRVGHTWRISTETVSDYENGTILTQKPKATPKGEPIKYL